VAQALPVHWKILRFAQDKQIDDNHRRHDNRRTFDEEPRDV
jgi:hypothetical protein